MKDISRRTFLGSATAAAIGAITKVDIVEAHTKRPNVLFILPDEWRGQALGCMGDANARTPNLDKLASDGILFENVIANTPVCCPARAVMLSGTYASTNGMVANDLRLAEKVHTFAHSFAGAEYQTAFIGKWHLDGGPRSPGFVPRGPRRHGFQYWAANECNHNYFSNWYFRDSELIESDDYEPAMWTGEAIRFLKQRDTAKPFFLMLSIGAPHEPYLAPAKFMEKYDPSKLTMRRNWVDTPYGTRKDLAGYYAGVEAVDDQVGRLLQMLDELKLSDDTIVFFSSDHGNMLGSQGKVWKRKPFEESIRVPGIVRWPSKVKPGSTTKALLSHVDFAPTMLSLCNIAVPKGMQGVDMSQTILGQSGKTPDSSFLQIFGPSHLDSVNAAWRGIRTERYCYARTEDAPWLLYDLENDPYEEKNLVDDAKTANVMKDLDAQLAAWMAKTGDSWALNWHTHVEDGAHLYEYEAFYTVDEYLAWAKAHPYLVPNLPN